MSRARYSGGCDVCGRPHTRSYAEPWSDEPTEDFFGVGCEGPDCDPRNSAFMTRDPDTEDSDAG